MLDLSYSWNHITKKHAKIDISIVAHIKTHGQC